MPVLIHLHRERLQPGRETNAFLKSFFHFFMVKPVRRRIAELLAVSNRDTAAALQEREDIWRAILLRGLLTLCTNGAGMSEKLLSDFGLFVRPNIAHCLLAALGREDF